MSMMEVFKLGIYEVVKDVAENLGTSNFDIYVNKGKVFNSDIIDIKIWINDNLFTYTIDEICKLTDNNEYKRNSLGKQMQYKVKNCLKYQTNLIIESILKKEKTEKNSFIFLKDKEPQWFIDKFRPFLTKTKEKFVLKLVIDGEQSREKIEKNIILKENDVITLNKGKLVISSIIYNTDITGI